MTKKERIERLEQRINELESYIKVKELEFNKAIINIIKSNKLNVIGKEYLQKQFSIYPVNQFKPTCGSGQPVFNFPGMTSDLNNGPDVA